jgi:hypothetical protein
LSNFDFILENLLELKCSYDNVTHLSHCTFRTTIAVSGSKVSQSQQVKQQVKQVLVPALVQPSRTNRGSRMADIMENIEEDDDSRAIVSWHKKNNKLSNQIQKMCSVFPKRLIATQWQAQAT